VGTQSWSCLFGGNADTQSCLSGLVRWFSLCQSCCLVLSIGSVFAGSLVVGPSVELLCCSTSGSWAKRGSAPTDNPLTNKRRPIFNENAEPVWQFPLARTALKSSRPGTEISRIGQPSTRTGKRNLCVSSSRAKADARPVAFALIRTRSPWTAAIGSRSISVS
jgi:hypothetical protein